LLYTAGRAAAGDGAAETLIHGYALGSISMTCHGIGVGGTPAASGGPAAAAEPDAPAEQSNI
jgi:4,5-DOPA dioxygenase extradiol